MWFKKSSETMWIEPWPKPLKIGKAETVLDVALSNNLDIGHACEGMGSCTTCRVFLLEGDGGPRTEIEEERAKERGFAETERLACQLQAKPGLRVRIPS